ncbi:Phd_YefM protein [Variibacter gotjawalensis]|uniref:Antitoxin n=1 Tax=Variibacter gotjawalensis TaxID=1333996 RepID=A0A0S3PPZ3_9BRAD|nr:type II toxin-antitoxin system prevent-host-death family antitoxin [Variibacter gotjawalensis]NIK48246.1 prevent-host-death family protein [Variibacter gotjawalensis]RZS50118.1 prevent-host-death family protein [Variibacter gotjawalensis]BAT57948.1 Phd_YefM protein [Variibacter gotjawalensis]
MTRFTTSDLSRKSGDIIAEALRHPVTITQRNKPRLVMLSIEDYRRLTERGDSRKAGTLSSIDQGLLNEIETAVADYEQDGDDR